MSQSYIQFQSQEENLHFPDIFDVSPQELAEKRNQVYLIDVRQPDEYTGDLGHIPGSQLLVLDTLPQNLKSLPQDKAIVFICRSGGRSARAAAFAKANGITQVYNLKGGMLLWNELHLETEI